MKVKKLIVAGIVSGATLFPFLPSYANSSPEQGFRAGVNAACRYKIRNRVDTNSAISYIMSGLTGPDADWTNNFARANRVGIPVAGSYALGLVDAISGAKDQKAFIYSWIDAVNRQCG